MPWSKLLVTALSLRSAGFDPSLVHVGFVAAKVVLGHAFVRVRRFSPRRLHSTVVLYSDFVPLSPASRTQPTASLNKTPVR
jgi:hypothetical protein